MWNSSFNKTEACLQRRNRLMKLCLACGEFRYFTALWCFFGFCPQLKCVSSAWGLFLLSAMCGLMEREA